MIKAIEPLGRHDRAAFSCGVAALDDWFRLRAGQDEKRNVARVFVAIDDKRGVVGFYSCSSFTIAIADLPPELGKRLPRYDAIPAALIGRLARDQRVRAKGIGALLLADAIRRVIGPPAHLPSLRSSSMQWVTERHLSTGPLDLSHFQTAPSGCSCLRPKRQKLFRGHCRGRLQAIALIDAGHREIDASRNSICFPCPRARAILVA